MSTELNPSQLLRAALVLADSGRTFRQNLDGVLQWLDGKPAPTAAEMEAAYRRSFPVLTARQLRLWLIGAGLSPEAVDTQITAIPDATARAKARVEWEYATAYHRTHPLVSQLGAALGLSAAQIDAAFLTAGKL